MGRGMKALENQMPLTGTKVNENGECYYMKYLKAKQ